MSFEHPHLSPGPPGTRTLRVRVAEEGRLPESAVLRLARELAEALSWLHAAKRRHGRLTPDAISFDAQGRAVLALDAPAPDADKGWVPFEQGAGKQTPASDLYQLGATLLFAASAREPVAAGLPLAFRAPPELGGLSAPARELMEWLVEPRWDRRPPDAAAVARDASEALNGRPNARRLRRSRGRASVAAGVALLLTALVFGLRRDTPPADAPQDLPVARRTLEPPTARPATAPVPRVALDWNRVTGPYPDVMRVSRDETGDVVVFTKYEVTRFKAGIPSGGETALNDILVVVKDLTGPSQGDGTSALTFAVGTVEPGGRVWTGGWDGGVQGHHFPTDKYLNAPPLGESGRVEDMAVRGPLLYAAHRGTLRSWRDGDADWKPVGLPAGSNPKALFVSRGQTLYAGGSKGVWREDAGTWTQVWASGGGPGDEVRSLGEDAEGNLLVGTRDGLLILDGRGRVLGRHLRGKVVTSTADGPEGRLWVGTWDGGLHVRVGGTWHPFGYAYGLPDDTVSGVAVDRQGLLWVGLYGHGVVVRTESEAAAAAVSAKSAQRLNGETYHSLTDAARRNLSEGKASGDVARLELGGLDYVYFGGRQVSPPGVGALGPDGTSARREGGAWLLRRPGGADVALPPMPRVRDATSAMLDSRGRLWVGTDRTGVSVYADGAWTNHAEAVGLDDNPVRALAEDKAGRVWAATSPLFDAKSGRYARKNLHRFDGDAWRHWSPADGLGYWASQDVRALPDGSVAAATNGGVSLLTPSADGAALKALSGPEGKDVLRASVLAPLGKGALLTLHLDAGLTLSEGDAARRITSRSGLFSDSLTAAAADGRGNVWLLASDGRAFIAPLSALREAK